MPGQLLFTFATELLEADIDLLTIQGILGHASVSTTAIYTHVRRDRLRSVARVLDLLPLEQLRQVPLQTAAGKRSTRGSKSGR